MQQSVFRQLNPSGTRLPLAKFSYTSTPIDHPGPLSWSHINGHGDLVCVLDKFPAMESSSSKLILKVTQNDSILEQIDIARLVQSNMSQNGLMAKSSFAVVVKVPCLAVKYPQNGSIRRFQLKFLVEHDFYTALSLLSEINCPFTEGNAAAVQPQRRPPSSSSWASFQTPTAAVGWQNGNIAMTPESNASSALHPMVNLHGGTSMCNAPPAQPGITPDIVRPLDHEMGATRSLQQISEPQIQAVQQVACPANTSSRPSTDQGYHDIQALNQILPPKRDLPFLKPSTKRQPTEIISEKAAEKPTRKPSRMTQLAKQSNQNTVGRCDTIRSDISSQSLVPTQPYIESIERESTQPNALPDTGSQPQNTQEPIDTALPMPAAEKTTAKNIQVERTQSPTQRADPISIQDQFSAYLESPTPERLKFLENWMCELLNDDGFMTLCQDVDATWQRFAFGTKK